MLKVTHLVGGRIKTPSRDSLFLKPLIIIKRYVENKDKSELVLASFSTRGLEGEIRLAYK